MATAAIIGGGAMLAGNILSGIGSSKQAKAQADAAQQAQQAAQQQQAIENQRAEALFNPALQAQQTQLALLGQGGPESAQQAAAGLMDSPLVSAINEQNMQNIQAQAAASGVSGGNLLTALQQANTANILQAGFGGLGQVAGQQMQGALGFGGLAQGSLGMANQATMQYGQAKGAQNAIPWLVGSNIINQGAQLGLTALGGMGGMGGAAAPASGMASVGAASPTTTTMAPITGLF